MCTACFLLEQLRMNVVCGEDAEEVIVLEQLIISSSLEKTGLLSPVELLQFSLPNSRVTCG